MNLRAPFRIAFYRDYNLLKKRTFKRCSVSQNKLNTSKEDDDKTTHFGFKTIKESEKTKEGMRNIMFLIRNFIIHNDEFELQWLK